MCGIWALLGYEGDSHVFMKDFAKIRHRGPNGYRFQHISDLNNVVIGFHRLSIVQKKGGGGMQPICVPGCEQIYCIANSMVYNYKGLVDEFSYKPVTKCDVEAFVHLYNHLGMPGTFQQIDGVFGACIIDANRHKVYLGRDTFGVKPCFYFYEENGILAVASEIKGIIEVLQSMNKPVSEIRPVLPGHYVEMDVSSEGKVSNLKTFAFTQIGEVPKYRTLSFDIENAWQISPNMSKRKQAPNGLNISEKIFENIRTYFNAAVKKRLLSERRVGCLLSGGLDSSLVASLTVKNLREQGISYPVQTFTIGLAGSTDVIAARKVADYLQTEHYEVSFTDEEGIQAVDEVIELIESYDITTIRASVVMYLICAYIRKHTNTVIILSGEGSDELLQGYLYFHQAPDPEAADKDGRRLLSDLHYFDVLRADRTICGNGLDPRVPFLDHRFTSYMLSLPSEYRRPHNGMEKWILRKAFSNANVLPEDILWRSKEAFSDGVSSQEKSWYEILNDHLKTKVTDEMLANASKLFPINTPTTHESYYYRMVYERHYPSLGNQIPYFWMPNWSDTKDPSARTLQQYKSSLVE